MANYRRTKTTKKKKPPRDVNETAFDVMRRIIERTEKPVRKPAKKSPRR